MKKTVLITMILFAGFTTQAQQTVRIGYVDMEYILENVPEYQEASAQLETKVQQWKNEIEAELKKIETMRNDLENEKPLLTTELIEEREEEIDFEEQKILQYQQNRFGPNGDLMTQKLQLVQPIQDQVFIAVQEIATNRDYDVIYNKSAGDMAMLYVAERLDVSDQVLRSITRASNREQLETRQERQELLREESKTVEESAAVTERKEAQEELKTKQEMLLEERRRTRDSIKTAKQQEYEARRAKIIEERQKKKDSITEAREGN